MGADLMNENLLRYLAEVYPELLGGGQQQALPDYGLFGPSGAWGTDEAINSAGIVGSTYPALPANIDEMSDRQILDAWVSVLPGGRAGQSKALLADVDKFGQMLDAGRGGEWTRDMRTPGSNFDPGMIGGWVNTKNPNTKGKSKTTKLVKGIGKYAPLALSFGAGAGVKLPGILGKVADGKSFLGKAGQLALGGGKVSNNPLFNYGAKIALGKQAPWLRDNMIANQAGGIFGPMLGMTPKPQPTPAQQGGGTSGTDYRPGGGYGSQAPGGGANIPIGSPQGVADMGSYGLGKLFEGVVGGAPIPGFGGTPKDIGFDSGKALQLALNWKNAKTTAGGIGDSGASAGGSMGLPNIPNPYDVTKAKELWPGAKEAAGGIFGGGAGVGKNLPGTQGGIGAGYGAAPANNSGLQMAALGLLSQLLNKKDKDPPKVATPAAPPTYKDLGLITNQDAQRDQLNRLRAQRDRLNNPYIQGVA